MENPAVWPDVVLWDIDGTLVESTELAWTSTNKVLVTHGFDEISLAEYKEATRFTTPARLAFHATQNTDDPIGVTMAKEFDDLYVGLVSPETVPTFAGLLELLEELAANDVPVGALSNACGAYVRAVLASHGLHGQFRCEFGADDVPEAKPGPGGLLHCCSVIGVPASKTCVYVGDTLGDAKAAKAAGFRSIGVRWGGVDEDVLRSSFDEVVGSADELLAALKRS